MKRDVLSRFEGVRKTGPDHGVARCAAHGDKHASLSWRLKSDGVWLLHCFAGCSVDEVLAAAGLDLNDLFPDNPAAGMFNHHRSERRPFNPFDILACLALETAIALDCANQLRAGKALSPDDHARLVTACGRLVAGMDIANGQ